MAFDQAYYLANNPDVASALSRGLFGGQAINHYNEYGAKEGRLGSAADASAKSVNDSAAAVQKQIATDTAARSALLERQNATQQGLFDTYKSTLGGQENSTAMYDRLNKELGIPDLGASASAIKGQIYSVKDLLDRLDEDVNSRVSGSFVSSAQGNRIKAAEGGQLNTQLGRLTTGLAPVADMLSSAQSTLGTRLQLGQADNERALDPLKLQINSLSDRFAREISGFDSNSEETLNGLMDKLQRDRALSDREWQAAQDLAASERDYQQKLSLAAASGGGGGGGFGLGGSVGGGTPSNPRQSAFQNRLSQLLPANFNSQFNSGYTERTVIPLLQREFPEYANLLGLKTADNPVYAYRKQFE